MKIRKFILGIPRIYETVDSVNDRNAAMTREGVGGKYI